MSKDPDQYKVYAAEQEAFAGTFAGARLGHVAVVESAGVILRSAWWQANVGRAVTIRPLAWGDDEQCVESVAWHRGRITAEVAFGAHAPLNHATHELSHAAQPERSLGHGSKFRGLHLVLVDAYFGSEMRETLHEAYTRHDVGRVIIPDLVWTSPIHHAEREEVFGWHRPLTATPSAGVIAL